MTYQKQTWVAKETVVSAARMNHIEEGIAAEAAKTAVSYELNNRPSIPTDGGRTVPTGWAVVGEEIPAITYSSEAGGFRVNVAGTYLVALNGSYSNGPTSGNMEYRVDLNTTRVLAVYGSSGDISSRSGTIVVQAAEDDLIVPNYGQTSGDDVTLRGNSFNSITIAQIG